MAMNAVWDAHHAASMTRMAGEYRMSTGRRRGEYHRA